MLFGPRRTCGSARDGASPSRRLRLEGPLPGRDRASPSRFETVSGVRPWPVVPMMNSGLRTDPKNIEDA